MKKNVAPKPYGGWNAETSESLVPDGALFPASARHKDRRRAEGQTEGQENVPIRKNKIGRKILK